MPTVFGSRSYAVDEMFRYALPDGRAYTLEENIQFALGDALITAGVALQKKAAKHQLVPTGNHIQVLVRQEGYTLQVFLKFEEEKDALP